MNSIFKFLLFFLFLSIFILPVAAKEETEPNNTEKTSNPISPGECIMGHTGMKSEEGFIGDIDIFSFKAQYAGKITVYAGVVKKYGIIEGNPSIRLDLLNSDELKADSWKDPYSGKVLSPVFDGSGSGARSLTIGKAGTVYLRVDRCGADAYYKFTVIYQPEGKPENQEMPDSIEEVEPNDIPSQANSLPLRQPVTGHTGNMGKYGLEGNKDCYVVEVPSPGKLLVFVTIKGKYFKDETGNPSLRVYISNADEMTSGPWKDPDTGEDKSAVFNQGTEGRCIFIKSGGQVFLVVDRYEANASYKLTVVFQGE